MNIYKHKGLLQRTIIATVFIILFNLISPIMMLVSKAALTKNYESVNQTDIVGLTDLNTALKKYGITKSAYNINFNSNGKAQIDEPSADGKYMVTFIVSMAKGRTITTANGAENVYSISFSKETKIKDYKNNGVDVKDELNEGSSLSGSDIASGKAGTDKNSNDDEDDSKWEDLGGSLLSPFVAFVNFIADSVASGLQTFMVGNDFNKVMKKWKKVEDEISVTNKDNIKDTVTIERDYGFGTYYPNFKYSCEEIFANKVPMLDINFLNPSVTDSEGNFDEEKNIAAVLQDVIKAWFRVLRLIAIVGLLSVLIYIGIRIMIDANSSNKAKYKEKLIDWLVALVIVFTMQYIMSFTITMTQELTNLFSGQDKDTRNIEVVYQPDGKKEATFKTNLIGLTRFQVQDDNFYRKVTYEVLYIALLVYTIKFTIVYLKRVMQMAFLTLVSPLVALMYPLQDRNSSAFMMWLKEYLFNALLQPMHYLLYTVLITSAISLAAHNPLYAVVALMFMSQAEKFLKTIFGFDKAKGGMVGGMSAFAGGALATTLFNGLRNGGKNILSNGNGKNGADGTSGPNGRPPLMKKDTDIDGILPTDTNTENYKNYENTNVEIPNNQVDIPEPQAKTPEVQAEIPEINTPPMQPLTGPADPNMAQNYEQWENAKKYQEELAKWKEQQAEQQRAQDVQNIMAQQPRETINLADSIGNQAGNIGKKDIAKNIAKNAGKKIRNKVWDPGKSKKYNLSRIGNTAFKGLRTYAQAGMAVAGAAAQMGFSITDGDFNPIESVVTGIGAAAATGKSIDSIKGKAIKAGANISDTYNNLAYGDEQAAFNNYARNWNNDVNIDKQYKEQYKQDYKTYKQMATQEMLPRGITDFKEQKQVFKYAESVLGEKYNQWETNEKEVIRKQNANYTDEEVQIEFNRRKAEQAQEIRNQLGKEGRKLNDDQAIRRGIISQSVREGAATLKFRQQAANKNALLGANREAFRQQQIKAQLSKGHSQEQATAIVDNAFNKMDRFDAVNNQ